MRKQTYEIKGVEIKGYKELKEYALKAMCTGENTRVFVKGV